MRGHICNLLAGRAKPVEKQSLSGVPVFVAYPESVPSFRSIYETDGFLDSSLAGKDFSSLLSFKVWRGADRRTTD